MILPHNGNEHLSLDLLNDCFGNAQSLMLINSQQIHTLTVTHSDTIINSDIKEYNTHINKEIIYFKENDLYVGNKENSNGENIQQMSFNSELSTSKQMSTSPNQFKTLRIGWLHKENVTRKYRRVEKPLGGVKRLKLDTSVEYTADDIRRRGLEEFSNNGNNPMEEKFSVHLGFYNGEIITDFHEPNGNICDIWGYCRAMKRKLFDVNIFILTFPKDETDLILNKLPIYRTKLRSSLRKKKKEDKDNIQILYNYERVSKYSNEISRTEYDIVDIYTSFIEDNCGDGPSIEDFEPLDYGHAISKIKKDEDVLLEIYIETESTKSFHFPLLKEMPEDVHTIIYDIDVLQGIYNGKFGIGVIPNCTDVCRPIFTWYRDGEIYKTGEFLYWLNDVRALLYREKHVWSCTIHCQKNNHDLKSKDFEIRNE